MAKVTFDGENKIISVMSGITALDVKVDLYSDWKEWQLTSDNIKYEPAFRAIGGDPIGAGLFAGSFFFVINGWKLRPDEADHTLVIDGNLFGEDGATIVIQTLGDFTVSTQIRNSSQAQGISTGSGLSATQSDMLRDIFLVLGLDPSNPLTVSTTARDAGAVSQTIAGTSPVVVTRV